MSQNFLEFEKPIAELHAQIDELRNVSSNSSLNIDLADEIANLEKKSVTMAQKIFSSLGPWQISQLARHPQRPYSFDYIDRIFEEFDQLHGDRAFADDKAIIGGIARLDGQSVMVIGHQKGRSTP
ncbi:MAG: acetyl-CoA carboxylase carboxyl transferase subunit alpha, partial [Gammaproteobacteria bacterium]|nr:acetyl-CoA carboxylase carboxyl transferase subunit alpha [Gammaproteobacteria bacterium]